MTDQLLHSESFLRVKSVFTQQAFFSLAWAIVVAMSSLSPPMAAQDNRPDSLWTRPTGDDWPIFLGSHRDGKSRERGFEPKTWKEQVPKLVWKLELSEGYAPCTVSRGRVFHYDRDADNNRLRCLNAETGKTLWTFRNATAYQDHYGYDGGPRCSPLVDDERVYLFDAAGMLHCLKTATGEVIWKVDTQETFGVVQNFFGVGSNPVIDGERLLVMIGGSPKEDQTLLSGQLDQVRGNGSGIVAFDKRNGKILYKLSDQLASYSSLQLANINNRKWCFAFARGGLLAFNPVNGKQDFYFPWRAKLLESVNASTPVVQNDEVLISETYGPGAALLKVRPDEPPKVVWKDEDKGRDKSLQTHWNTPVVHDGYVYACSGRHTNNAELRCVEWKSGKVMWSQRRLTRMSLTYLDGHLLCQGEYGDLLVIRANPEKFEPVAMLPPPTAVDGSPLLKYPCWAAPVVSHGLMWVRGEGHLLCYDIIPVQN